MHSSYVGRFAPSPSGSLHLGSLVSALASYLDAKHNGGKWLLRIEDVDSQRCKPIHSQDIIDTLSSYHMSSDETVIYQSQQTDIYQKHLSQLIKSNKAFPCQCTRQALKQTQGKHTQVCDSNTEQAHSWRFLSSSDDISFVDRLMGQQIQNPLAQIGHSIIKRKDLDYAYLLAVVIDDHIQGVNQIVRGTDLLETTAAQIDLLQTFGWPLPEYCHIPLVKNEHSLKLSKQNHAPAIKKADIDTFKLALKHLNQPIPDTNNLADAMHFAIKHWSLRQVHQTQTQT
ncbi:hypothetical protein OA92_19375 [Marinomonas sp. SBI22]|uniref:tRNA glutamyl-Q(34) synthetase GluQRS n=1 Tax=unclassified Marinomonas TaxID=196814 RepID=UPI0007AEF095|nr:MULTISPECIES: tRNA glutamyl-Q(34) synthetase GluQRS [unclassified Marinomonas]KZM39800.1 hypothetical protein OA92_19375 [Marinomonas sp. SBI22]KZM41176.1 hypothetical protein OA91_18610 [Marinomonas sp. SBI8L]